MDLQEESEPEGTHAYPPSQNPLLLPWPTELLGILNLWCKGRRRWYYGEGLLLQYLLEIWDLAPSQSSRHHLAATKEIAREKSR